MQDNSLQEPKIAKQYALKREVETRRLTIPYADELNEAQLKAVKAVSGPQLVIAGAGSGKTRTLIYRVAYLIESGIPPEQILLLTFTKRAAEEMMRRASLLLDGRCSQIRGGTFHGFANTTLRRYAQVLGYPNSFTIADRSDSEDIINLLRPRLKGSKDKEHQQESDRRFPKKGTLINIISKSHNTGRSFSEIIGEDYPQYIEEEAEIARIAQEFARYKKENAILDYDDLLLCLRELLSEHPQICSRLSDEHRYIMVDEYQDTNSLQAEIAYLLASNHQNLMVVGDDAQSIYSFRGASFRNIMDFPRKYANCNKTVLAENYRSSQNVLDFCNSLIRCASERHDKELFSSITSEQKPVFVQMASISEQASFIGQRILELSEENVPLNEIAVLFRSSWHSNDLEIELNSRNIPFVKFGGLRFVEAAHVKDIVAFLRIAHNPMDTVAWHRALLLFPGIGTSSATKIVSKVNSLPQRYDVLASKEHLGKHAKTLEPLHALLTERIRAGQSPQQVVRQVTRFYSPLLKDNYEDYVKRLDDLESLENLAVRYQNLALFLDDLSLHPPDLSQIGAEATNAETEQLTLSTIHSAKGLEWHTVFVISLIDGFIPSTQSLNREQDIEEERRLLYVACTRAKQNLYLTYPQYCKSRGYTPFGDLAFSTPSRFINDISNIRDVVEYWNVT